MKGVIKMKAVTNRFGTGNLYEAQDLGERVYCKCTACLGVYTDFLSWAQLNDDRIAATPDEADTVVILGCQVTDLAILNDLNHADAINHDNIFIGGCLAQRFDIDLDEKYKRLDVVRIENQQIKNFALVDYAKPFWVTDFDEGDNLSQGNLFRNYYPLKIGAGCKGKCKFCTIRDTRGDYYEVDPFSQIDEFINHRNVVLISDSPTVEQVIKWCAIAIWKNKPISIRNIEPKTLVACSAMLEALARNKLLDIVHCPIQSNDMELVKAMGRNAEATKMALRFLDFIRIFGVKIATNIIIDYTDSDGNFYANSDFDFLDRRFDYVSWNPFFDGNWNREKAVKRWNKYFDA